MPSTSPAGCSIGRGCSDVKIEPTPGQLTDHYDPRGKVLRVSTAVAGRIGARRPPASAARRRASRWPPRRSSPTRSATPSRTRSATRPWRSARRSCPPPVRLGHRPVADHRRRLPPADRACHRRPHRLRRGGRSSRSRRCRSRSAPSGKALAFVNGLGMVGERQDGARAVLKAAAWTYVAGRADRAADVPVLRVAHLRPA